MRNPTESKGSPNPHLADTSASAERFVLGLFLRRSMSAVGGYASSARVLVSDIGSMIARPIAP